MSRHGYGARTGFTRNGALRVRDQGRRGGGENTGPPTPSPDYREVTARRNDYLLNDT